MALITFDFHDTLAHNDPWFQLEIRSLPALMAAAYAPHLDEAEVTATYRELRKVVMNSGVEVDAYDGVQRVLRDHGVSVPSEALNDSIDAAMRAVVGHSHAVDGVADLVDELRLDGHRLGVVSSAIHHDFLEWTLDALGVLDAFDFVLSSARAGFYKSDSRIYRKALELGSTDAPNAVHIGDSLAWDVRSAASVGIRTILLDHGRPQPDIGVEPDLTVTSFVGQRAAIRDFIDGSLS